MGGSARLGGHQDTRHLVLRDGYTPCIVCALMGKANPGSLIPIPVGDDDDDDDTQHNVPAATEDGSKFKDIYLQASLSFLYLSGQRNCSRIRQTGKRRVPSASSPAGN